MGSARGSLQVAILVFNTLSVVVSIVAIAATVGELDRYRPATPPHTAEIVQLCAACALLVSAFVGCYAAVQDSVPTLATFIAILTTLLLTHAWRLLRHDEPQLASDTEALVAYAWLEELVKPGSMHPLQQKHECCGKESPVDYTSLGLEVPASCYAPSSGDGDDTEKIRELIHPFDEGCAGAVTRDTLTAYRFERLGHCAIVVYEIIGIALAASLIGIIAKRHRRYSY